MKFLLDQKVHRLVSRTGHLESSDLSFQRKILFLKFLVVILPVDSQIFADPGSHNDADQTNLDPKLWGFTLFKFIVG